MSNADKEALERELVRAQSKAEREAREGKEKDLMRQWKKEERDKQSQGKKAFHLKRCEFIHLLTPY